MSTNKAEKLPTLEEIAGATDVLVGLNPDVDHLVFIRLVTGENPGETWWSRPAGIPEALELGRELEKAAKTKRWRHKAKDFVEIVKRLRRVVVMRKILDAASPREDTIST